MLLLLESGSRFHTTQVRSSPEAAVQRVRRTCNQLPPAALCCSWPMAKGACSAGAAWRPLVGQRRTPCHHHTNAPPSRRLPCPSRSGWASASAWATRPPPSPSHIPTYPPVRHIVVQAEALRAAPAGAVEGRLPACMPARAFTCAGARTRGAHARTCTRTLNARAHPAWASCPPSPSHPTHTPRPARRTRAPTGAAREGLRAAFQLHAQAAQALPHAARDCGAAAGRGPLHRHHAGLGARGSAPHPGDVRAGEGAPCRRALLAAGAVRHCTVLLQCVNLYCTARAGAADGSVCGHWCTRGGEDGHAMRLHRGCRDGPILFPHFLAPSLPPTHCSPPPTHTHTPTRTRPQTLRATSS